MLINPAKVYIDLSFLFVHMHRLNVQNNDHLYSGLWWFRVVYDGLLWFLVGSGCFWLFIVVSGCFWLFMVVYGG